MQQKVSVTRIHFDYHFSPAYLKCSLVIVCLFIIYLLSALANLYYPNRDVVLFYEYTCRNLKNVHSRPGEEEIWNRFTTEQQKIQSSTSNAHIFYFTYQSVMLYRFESFSQVQEDSNVLVPLSNMFNAKSVTFEISLK